MNTLAFSIRRTIAADWREIRDLRLEMIRDTPSAYNETLEGALGNDEAEWRMRGERGTADHGIAVAAIDNAGRWVGAMAGFVSEQVAGPLLVGVYVAPGYRGGEVGVTDALLRAIEAWARTESGRLFLHVHEDNARARTAYERRGFTATGEALPYNLDPGRNELEMVKELEHV
ncbi:GNAT family N-acetyltransferase [Cryobacterium sp. TMT1-2-1]|uniref:GNAT family N-acetyltransferase n=1 Tax=Cryobacterium sp. TMT1-2-1 TaxID=1259232 RepID=UPI001F53FAAC|nr:GNAT family N-acetyltransferase [Cryobacterium sp. TMT1-2-1]